MAVLVGSKIIDVNVRPVKEIFDENKEIDVVTVSGEVTELEIKGPYDDGRRLYRGAIYDRTSTMFFRFYNPDLLDIQVGTGLKIQGPVKYHQGTRELTIFVNSAENYQLPKKEYDDGVSEEEGHTVHLQTYSFMTDKRGGVPVSRYFNKAAALGHKAVAVTDLGVGQAFPEAFKSALKTGVKAIYGMTAYMVDSMPVVYNPSEKRIVDCEFVVFDTETTGFSSLYDQITEVAAASVVGLNVADTFSSLVKGDKHINKIVEELTGINDQMRAEEGRDLKDVLLDFKEFIGDRILVAHNAWFDLNMIREAYKKAGIEPPPLVIIDTLKLSRLINKELKTHNLGKLTRHYGVKLLNAHRATDDAVATAEVFIHMMNQVMENHGVVTLADLNSLIGEDDYLNQYPYELPILVLNQTGLKNLYELISYCHTKQLSSLGSIDGTNKPILTWDLLQKYRDGLFVGSGSHLGNVFNLGLERGEEVLEAEIKSGKYDYFEIQPTEVAQHWWNHDRPKTDSESNVTNTWKMIYRIAKQYNKMVVATAHAHYADPGDETFVHNLLIYSALPPKRMSHEKRNGRMEYPQGPCHFRTTKEMLDSFPWLSEEEKREVVIVNPNRIADMVEVVKPFPVDENNTPILFTPKIEGINEQFREMAYKNAKKMYGDPLPKNVEERLEKELTSITKHGFAVIYMITHEIVKQSLNDDYLVGSRGSVGSSLAATMTEITEVNPMPPHYLCSECKFSIFFNHQELLSGYDLPYSFKDLISGDRFTEDAHQHFLATFMEKFNVTDEEKMRQAMINHEEKTCPVCKKKALRGDGHDIPFETFLGFHGDKVPDIDLNFSGEYQSKAHQFVVDRFGEEYVYRAGTIGTVAEKTAFAYVRNYFVNHGIKVSNAEIARLASKVAGAKQSTGQHPGGMLVCPDYMDMTDIAPYQFPANDPKAQFKTSHVDFHSIHDNILKLDILGHDNPTQLRYAKDFTGIDPRTIPGADPKVLQLFYDPEKALGVNPEEFLCNTGTLGLPEMGTRVVRDVITETIPKTYGDLVTLSGLTHGTDVYYNNAQTLIKDGTATIRDVIGCRDDIMRTLILKGVESSLSFKIMESVRKGKGLAPEMEEEMKKNQVPDWYVWSCKLIKYMFPKAHACAYVTDAMRMGWFKVYYPIEFYASVFSAKYNTESILELTLDVKDTKLRMEELAEESKKLKNAGEKNKAKKIDDTLVAMHLALEAKVRGIKFGGIRMYESHHSKYLIDWEKNELIPPFKSIDGIGPNAAIKLYEERKNGAFRGLDDLKARTGVTAKNIAVLRDMGCLDLIEETQHKSDRSHVVL